MKRITYFITILSSLLLFVSLCSCNSTEVPTATPNRGMLRIEAQIIYNTGGPQPVARDTFYLLDADLLNVEVPKPPDPKSGITLAQAMQNLSPAQQLKLTMMIAHYMKSAQEFARQRGKELPNTATDKTETLTTIKLSIDLLKKDKETASHFIQSTVTDFEGRATFENLKPGDYWIMGATETRADSAFWNHKVTIKQGENKVLLDQNNTQYSK